MRATAPGNDGVIGFSFDFPEITPPVLQTGEFYFNASSRAAVEPGSVTAAQKVRAVIESQALSMRLNASKSGITDITRIVVTGGASENQCIIQVIADVFGAQIVSIAQKDSASIGAAFRAAWALHRQTDATVAFHDVIGKSIQYKVS